MSRWTHRICGECWIELHPESLVPVTMCASRPGTCCRCGNPTRLGIYIRMDPEAAEHCRCDEKPRPDATGYVKPEPTHREILERENWFIHRQSSSVYPKCEWVVEVPGDDGKPCGVFFYGATEEAVVEWAWNYRAKEITHGP